MIIEIDGGQHDDAQTYDEERTRFLRKKGFKVVRFWNNEVLQNLEIVLAKVLKELLGCPSPARGEVKSVSCKVILKTVARC